MARERPGFDYDAGASASVGTAPEGVNPELPRSQDPSSGGGLTWTRTDIDTSKDCVAKALHRREPREARHLPHQSSLNGRPGHSTRAAFHFMGRCGLAICDGARLDAWPHASKTS